MVRQQFTILVCPEHGHVEHAETYWQGEQQHTGCGEAIQPVWVTPREQDCCVECGRALMTVAGGLRECFNRDCAMSVRESSR